MLGTDEGRECCAEQLLEGVVLDPSLSAILSEDLLERIDDTVGGREQRDLGRLRRKSRRQYGVTIDAQIH